MASPSSPLSPPSSSSLVVPASLYVGDLHHEINDARLHDAFAEYKSLSSVRVCRDSATGRSLCYGYVNFMSPQDGIYKYVYIKSYIDIIYFSVLRDMFYVCCCKFFVL